GCPAHGRALAALVSRRVAQVPVVGATHWALPRATRARADAAELARPDCRSDGGGASISSSETAPRITVLEGRSLHAEDGAFRIGVSSVTSWPHPNARVFLARSKAMKETV